MGGSTVAQTLWTGYSGVAQSAMSSVLGQMIPVVAAAMSGVLMLVVLITGKNLMFGELPIGEAVTRSVRALVVSALLTVSTFNTYVATFFTQTVPNQLASAISGGQAQAGAPAFDAMIDALTKIGAQTRAQMIGLQYIGDRVAEWVIEFAGKALISGCFLVWAVASLLVYFCVPLIALFAPMWLFDRTRAYGERAVGYVVGLVLVQALTLMVAAAFVAEENQLIQQYATAATTVAPSNPSFSTNSGMLNFTAFATPSSVPGNPAFGATAAPQGSSLATDAALEALIALAFTLVFGFFLLISTTVIGFTVAATSGFSAGSVVGFVSASVTNAVSAASRAFDRGARGSARVAKP